MAAGSQIARTGPLPGVTRDLTGFKVSSKPLAYLVDTPGVMIPKVEDVEVGLKLALTGTPILIPRFSSGVSEWQ
jgi:ribosome biogenesis GTPase A